MTFGAHMSISGGLHKAFGHGQKAVSGCPAITKPGCMVGIMQEYRESLCIGAGNQPHDTHVRMV